MLTVVAAGSKFACQDGVNNIRKNIMITYAASWTLLKTRDTMKLKASST